MTKTTAEKIAVMQAYERGEKIEVVDIHNPADTWDYTETPKWNWQKFNYRIAAPGPIPHTIDWSHVADGFNWMYTGWGDEVFIANGMPFSNDYGFYLSEKTQAFDARIISSLKIGNMPWQDSLVIRPKGV